METIIQKKPVWLKIIRRTARIIAVLFAIILFVLCTTRDMNPLLRNPHDYFIQILWILIPIGFLIGLWKEGHGGLISLVSTLTLIITFITKEGHHNLFYYMYIVLSVLLIPSILYLIYWYFNKTIKANANSEID
jgi:hypothetical protein